MELTTIKDAFDRVIKMQKLFHSKTQDVIDQVGHEIGQTLDQIQSVDDRVPHSDLRSIITELKLKLNALPLPHPLEGSHRELNMTLGRYVKVLEKLLNPDISRACRNIDFDVHLVNRIIAHHFYRQGLFDLGDSLVNDAGEEEEGELRSQFVEICQLAEAMKSRNIEPALSWVSANREKLKQNGSDLELKLHSLKYFEILKKGNRDDALAYARTHLSSLASLHMTEVQKLMASLLWVEKLENSPYADLVSPSNWDELADELTRHYYLIMDQPYKSPLTVALSAGFESLTTLLKLAHVMAAKKQDWQEMKQLPIPLELGKEFQFHSIFVCPVSREQSSEENPPMLMPCLHVLCKQSITKLSKNNSLRRFKCPYCPAETSAVECRQLYF